VAVIHIVIILRLLVLFKRDLWCYNYVYVLII